MRLLTNAGCNRSRSGRWSLLGAALAVLPLAACDLDSLLEVPQPDIVPGDVAADLDNLPALRNGVLFEFARAYTGPSGSNDFPGIIGTSGVFTDEMWYSSTFTQMRQMDARNVQTDNSGLATVFRYLHRARNWADVASLQYAESNLANTGDHALITNLGAYTHIFFGENYCSGVPLSRTTIEGRLEFGPGRTTEGLFDLALQGFSDAQGISQSAQSQDQLNLARVGEARALLNLGRFAEAAAVARDVPVGFSHMVEFSEDAAGQNNGIWGQINSARRSSLASREGTENQGLQFFNTDGETAGELTLDPRVPVTSRDIGIGTSIPMFRTGKYSTRGSNVPLASYVEAQLIVAESMLEDGQSSEYLSVLNALRANLATHLPTLGITPAAGASLSPLEDPGTREGRILQLFEERAFWLHMTAHRLGDLRRLMRQYGFAEAEVFPTGTTIFGQPYGNDVNFPIPFVEGNNPEFAGECFDRLP